MPQDRQAVGNCGRSFTEGIEIALFTDVVAESNATAPAGGQRYEVPLRAAVATRKEGMWRG